MKRFCWIFLTLLPFTSFSQIGGKHVYDFLNLVPAARVSAIGGANVSVFDYDPAYAFQNPAITNDSMHNQLSMSVVKYLAGVTYGNAGIGRSYDGIGDFHAGIQYVSYGKMDETDEYGNRLGTFTANDVVLVTGAARQFDNFRAGANLKLIHSSIARNSSFGIGLDIGGLYLSQNRLFSAGIVFKNIGLQLTKYTPTGEREPIPFEAQAGISYKLEHMPLRLSITTVNLETPNLVYTDPNTEPQFDLSGEEIKVKKRTGDKIFRHFVFGTEFLISKHVNLRAGYNHLRRQELRSENRAGLAGFSFGFGIKTNKFNLDYGYSNFHAAGGLHHFSVGTNLNTFSKR